MSLVIQNKLSPCEQVFSSGRLFHYLDSFQDSYNPACSGACKRVHAIMEERRVQAMTARRDQLLTAVSIEANYLASINATIEQYLGEIHSVIEMYPNTSPSIFTEIRRSIQEQRMQS